MTETRAPAEGAALLELYERYRAQVSSGGILDLTVEIAAQRDPDVGAAIRYCAIPRRFDASIIAVLRGDDDEARARGILERLRENAFVVPRSDGGWVYHDTVRDVLLEQWQAPDRIELFRSLNERLAGHYRALHQHALQVREQFRRVATLIRHGNEARYVALSARIDGLLLAPLLEALYHEVLRSPQRGYDFFENELHNRYEPAGQYAVCGALVSATRDYLLRRPGGDVDEGLLRWLDYYQARIENAQRQYESAEARLIALRDQTGDDHKLRQWILSELGTSYHRRFMMREALGVLGEELRLAEETGIDPFNLPNSYSRLGSVHWTLDELDAAAAHYERALVAGRRTGNRSQEVGAYLALSGLYQQRGLRARGFQAALDVLDLVRTQATHDGPLNYAVAERLTTDMKAHDPLLVHAFFAEALELLRARGDVPAEGLLRCSYVRALTETGQYARAEEQVRKAAEQIGTSAEPDVRAELIFAEALLREAEARAPDAIDAYDALIDLTEKRGASSFLRAAAYSNRGQQNALLGRWTEAEQDLEQALTLWQVIGHHRLAAFLRIMQAKAMRRRALYEQTTRSTPVGAAPRALAAARAALLTGELAAAEAAFEQAQCAWEEAGEQARAADVALERALVADQQGSWSDAAEHAERARSLWQKLAPLGAPAHLEVAPLPADQVSAMHALLDGAAAVLRPETPGYFADLCRMRGDLLFGQGRWADAARDFERAQAAELELVRHNSAASNDVQLARARAALGDWDGAFEAIDSAGDHWRTLAAWSADLDAAAIAAVKDNGRAVRTLVNASGDRSGRSLARDLLRTASRSVPRLFLFHLNHAYASADSDEYGEAAEAAESALRIAPTATLARRVADYRIEEATRARGAGRPGDAVRALGRAADVLDGAGAELDAETSTALWLRLADGMLQADHSAAAVHWYMRLRATAPARAHARLALVDLLRRDEGAAEEHLSRALEAAPDDDTAAAIVAEWQPYLPDVRAFRRAASFLRALSTRPGLAAAARTRLAAVRARFAPLLRVYVAQGETSSPAGTSGALLIVTPIVLEVHVSLLPPAADWEQHHPFLLQYAPAMRDRIRDDLGVEIPGVRVRGNETDMPHGTYLIMLNEVPLVMGTMPAGAWFCSAAAMDGADGIIERNAFDPRTGSRDGVWLDSSGAAAARERGTELLDHYDYMLRHVEHVVRRHIGDFVSFHETGALLREISADETETAALAEQVLRDGARQWRLVLVLRHLLREGVPIRDLGPVLAALAAAPGEEPLLIAERTRSGLRPIIAAQVHGGLLYALSEHIERTIAEASRPRAGRTFLALEPEPTQELLAAVRNALPEGDQIGTIVTQRPGIRPFVRRLFEIEFDRLRVLARNELPEQMQAQAAVLIARDGDEA